jgi:hypothetical protein
MEKNKKTMSQIMESLGYKQRPVGDVVNGLVSVQFKGGMVARFPSNRPGLSEYLAEFVVHNRIESIAPSVSIIKGKGLDDYDDEAKKVSLDGAFSDPKKTKKERIEEARKVLKGTGLFEDVRG